MEKTRYFPKVTENDISKSFGVPKNTLVGWKKYQNYEDNYRGYAYDKMGVISLLEQNAILKIKTLFTKKELQALWGSLKSTMYTVDIFTMPTALKYHFQDYCVYESTEASQFTEDELSLFSERVSEKLEKLCEFEKYVLINFIRSKEGEKFIF